MAIIRAGRHQLRAGLTQSAEYAEMEWPIGHPIEVVWVTYLILFVAPSCAASSRTSTVANWFYLAFILGDRPAAYLQQPRDAIDLFIDEVLQPVSPAPRTR